MREESPLVLKKKHILSHLSEKHTFFFITHHTTPYHQHGFFPGTAGGRGQPRHAKMGSTYRPLKRTRVVQEQRRIISYRPWAKLVQQLGRTTLFRLLGEREVSQKRLSVKRNWGVGRVAQSK